MIHISSTKYITKHSDMPVVSVNTSTTMRIDRPFIELLSTTSNTLIDGRPDDRITSIVVVGEHFAIFNARHSMETELKCVNVPKELYVLSLLFDCMI